MLLGHSCGHLHLRLLIQVQILQAFLLLNTSSHTSFCPVLMTSEHAAWILPRRSLCFHSKLSLPSVLWLPLICFLIKCFLVLIDHNFMAALYFILCIFKTLSHSLACPHLICSEDNLELLIFLYHSKGWDYRCLALRLAFQR